VIGPTPPNKDADAAFLLDDGNIVNARCYQAAIGRSPAQ
jgi:hypothetical protein